MKNLVRRILLVALSAVALCLAGCKDVQNIKNIKVTSVALESITPYGLRGVTASIAVGMDNPSFSVDLSEIEGALKLSGKVLGRMAMDPFTLHGKSSEMYHLSANVTIEPGVGLGEILSLLDMETINKCVVDVSVKATLKNGLTKVLTFNDIPVKDLIGQTYEKI